MSHHSGHSRAPMPHQRSSNHSNNNNNFSRHSQGSSHQSSSHSSSNYQSNSHSQTNNSNKQDPFPYCHDVEDYERIFKIGQGTFGEVFKAKHKVTKKIVAMKKVLMENEKEGFPITALREIKILQLLKHENVVNLIEICATRSQAPNYRATFYLVFDFCEHDLAGLLSNTSVQFNLGQVKHLMQQLLNGLYFIHKQKILHRDMKAANILITKKGCLKLADFGLARAIADLNTEQCRYTNRVVTLWYRPPELLLGARNYGPPIDLWGAGCILAEMWTRSPIMQGGNEAEQINLIVSLCGSITPEIWPNVEKLELYNTLKLRKDLKRKVQERLQSIIKCPLGMDLLDKLLILDPKQRIDSDDALNHPFFWTDPMPEDLEKLLSHQVNSNFEFTTTRRGRAFAHHHNPHHVNQSGHMYQHHQGPSNRPNMGGGNQFMDHIF